MTSLHCQFPGLLSLGCLASTVAFLAGCQAHKVGAATGDAVVLELVEKGSGTPLAGLVCELRSRRTVAARATSGPDGKVTFDRASTGNLTVDVTDPAGAHVRETFEVSASGSHRIEVQRGTRFRMRILDADGSPARQARISAWTFGAGILELEPVDAGDEWGPLPPGPAKLVVVAEGHEATLLDLEVPGPGRPTRRSTKASPSSEAAKLSGTEASADVGESPPAAELAGSSASPRAESSPRPESRSAARELLDLGEVRLRSGGTSLQGRVVSGRRLPQKAVLRYAGAGQIGEVGADGAFSFSGLPRPAPGRPAPKAMLILVRGSREVYARDLELGDVDADLGTIALE